MNTLWYFILIMLPAGIAYIYGKRLVVQLKVEKQTRILQFHQFRNSIKMIQIFGVVGSVILFDALHINQFIPWKNRFYLPVIAAIIFFVILSVNIVFFRFDQIIRQTTGGIKNYLRVYLGTLLILIVIYWSVLKVLFLMTEYWGTTIKIIQLVFLLFILVYGTPCLSPWLVKCIYRTNLLKNQDLKQRFSNFCKKVQVNCRNILVLETSDIKLSNALAVGLWPQQKYIYLTSYLIERLTLNEIETIFAHEVAHFKKNHIIKKSHLFFLLYLLIMPIQILVSQLATHEVSLYLFKWIPILVFIFTYLILSRVIARGHEKECDGFVIDHCEHPEDYEKALAKIYEDNYTPQDLSSSSHPSLSARIFFMRKRMQTKNKG